MSPSSACVSTPPAVYDALNFSGSIRQRVRFISLPSRKCRKRSVGMPRRMSAWTRDRKPSVISCSRMLLEVPHQLLGDERHDERDAHLARTASPARSEEHTSELQSQSNIVSR